MYLRLRVAVGSLFMALLSGCGSGGTVAAVPLPGDPTPSGVAYTWVPGGESFVASFELTLDPATMTASAVPIEAREGTSQPPQNLIYDLDIDQFLNADSFRILGLGFNADGDVQLDYSHTHPFPVPDFASAITALNRADLGYSGRLLVLAEGRTDSYFGGGVLLDPTLVTNADGYVSVGDLLVSPTPANNTYPFKLLADDFVTPSGNYDAANGGWQLATPLPWRGFDMVHPGTTFPGTLTVDPAALGSGPASFRVALLIKYVDPRGAGGRSLRFPPAVADPTQFAYRLPYAAMDASKIQVTGGFFIDAATGSSTDVDLQVRDWDATASEAATADLGGLTDVALIQPGASGNPVCEIDAPELSDTPAVGVVTSVGATGWPGDEIAYLVNVSNTLGTAPIGAYYGLARLTDPEYLLDDSGTHFGVDGITLLPTRTPLSAVTYQAIPYTVFSAGTAPEIIEVNPTEGCAGASVGFWPTNAGAPADSWSWDFGTMATPPTSTEEGPMVTLTDVPGSYTGSVVACAGPNCAPPFTFNFEVLGPWKTPYAVSGPAGRMWTPSMTIYNGLPVFVSIDWIPDAERITFGAALVPNPEASIDWNLHQLASYSTTGWSTQLSSAAPNLAVHVGRLYVTYSDYSAGEDLGQLSIAVANDVVPFMPSSSTDWTRHVIHPEVGESGSSSTIVTHDGELAVGYRYDAAASFWIALSTVTPPAATTDWTRYEVDGGPTVDRGVWCEMTNYFDGSSERLVATYTDLLEFNCHVARATTLSPDEPSDWSIHSAHPDDGDFHGLEPDIAVATIAGNPRFAVGWGSFVNPHLFVAIATTPTPSSASDYTLIEVDSFGGPQFRGVDIESIDGRLSLAYFRGDGPTLGHARALTDDPQLPGDFAITSPDSEVGAGFWPTLVQQSSGEQAILYRFGLNQIDLDAPLRYVVTQCN